MFPWVILKTFDHEIYGHSNSSSDIVGIIKRCLSAQMLDFL